MGVLRVLAESANEVLGLAPLYLGGIRRDPDGTHRARVGNYTVRAYGAGAIRFLYRDIFLRREYAVVLRGPTPVILDCGSNIGMSVLYFRGKHPGARITSFEPSPTAYRMLCRNIEANHLDGVHLVNAALGNEPGEVTFYQDPNNAGSLAMGTHQRGQLSQELRVPQKCLSDFIDGPVDLLKLDVEGAEHAVMSDLERTGKLALIDQAVIEYHHNLGSGSFGSFLSVLERAGFQYQLTTAASSRSRTSRTREFQDVIIHAYREGVRGGVNTPVWTHSRPGALAQDAATLR